VILYACEDCQTYSAQDPHARHESHHVLAIEGDDPEQLARTAAVHLVIAQAIRDGWDPSTYWHVPDARQLTYELWQHIQYARDHADWYCEEDAVYDKM
jgi:hypothetical protein